MATNPSIFDAAELAATKEEPKELIADCISTLEMENNSDYSPAGRPICIIRSSFLRSIRRFPIYRRIDSSLLRIRHSRVKNIDRYWVIVVAQATPSTVICSTRTKYKFRNTLMSWITIAAIN